MIETIKNIFSSADFWSIVVPSAGAIIAWFVNEQRKHYWERWKTKKDACEKALDMADAVLSTYEYPNVSSGMILKDEDGVDTIKARKIVNALACSCDTEEVLITFKKVLFGSVSPDIIVDLRNAVRKELKFGRKNIDNDRDRAFIGKLGADPKTKK